MVWLTLGLTTLLGLLLVWIATQENRSARILGAVAVLSIALTYGMIFGPMWKVNVLIVAAIALTWIVGRQKRELVRARMSA
jgi:hypothetical protein